MSTQTIGDDIIAKVKAENPGVELHLFENAHAAAIFRVPTSSEYQRFIDEQMKPETKGVALRTLVIACAVYPTGPEFMSMLERRPGLAQSFGNDLVEVAGLVTVTNRKKL